MTEKIIIYSHGFGVGRDDRGLFTDIAANLPSVRHVMFDYNQIHDDGRTMTPLPLDQQAVVLQKKIDEVRAAHPDAAIDVICHSQGCVTAGLALPSGIQKTIFLTPPSKLSIARTRMWRLLWSRLRITTRGIKFSRRDGTTTIVTPAFLRSTQDINPINLYNKLAKQTELIIIHAKQDHILAHADFSHLSPDTQIISLDGDHNFKNAARSVLLVTIRDIVL